MNRRFALMWMVALGLAERADPLSVPAQAWAGQPGKGGGTARRDPALQTEPISLEAKDPRDELHAVAFSHDGALVAAGGKNLDFWPRVDQSSVDGSGRHPRILTSGPKPTIRVWNCETGRLIRQLSGHPAPIFGLAFNHDRSQLVSGGPAKYVPAVESVRKNTKDYTTESQDNGRFFGVHPAGGLVTAWDIATGGSIHTFSSDGDVVERVAASQFFITSVDHGQNIRVWDADNGRAWVSLNGPPCADPLGPYPSFPEIAISADTMCIVMAECRGHVTRVDVSTARRRDWNDRGNACGPVAFSPDGAQVACWTEDGTPLLWDFRTMELVRACERRPGIDLARFGTGSTAIAFSRDGATLAFAWNDAECVNVCRWDTASGRNSH